MRVVASLLTIAASTGCDALFRIDNVVPLDGARGGDSSNSDSGSGSGSDASPPMCLDDNFGGAAIDQAAWMVTQPPGYAIAVSEGGGVLAFDLPPMFAGTNGVYSRAAYDMTGGYTAIQLVSANLGNSSSTGLIVQFDSNNSFELDVLNSELLFTTRVAGNMIDSGAAAVPTLPVYLRIHHVGGGTASITFDSSPDGATWTTMHAEPPPLPVDQLHVMLYGYTSVASDPSPGMSRFANLRLVGPNCH